MESKKNTQLEYIKDALTEFEKTEIFDYKSIYYAVSYTHLTLPTTPYV